MKLCPKCQAEIENSQMQFCSFCGSSLDSDSLSKPDVDDGSDLDFVVTESSSTDPEFVGGTKKFNTGGDKLEIQSPNESAEGDTSDAVSEPKITKSISDEELSPIGQSAPIMPGADYGLNDSANNDRIDPVNDEVDSIGAEEVPFKKLSDEDVKSITNDLYGSSEYMSKKEKGELLAKLSKIEQSTEFPGNRRGDKIDSSPEIDREQLSEPKMAPQSKGAAFFYKNYVELRGVQTLHSGDEVQYEGRQYTLSPKNLNSAWAWGAAATVFAVLLLFVGSLFVTDSTSPNGQIAGLVLDASGTPFIHGAELRLPDLGHSIESNAQGLFAIEDLHTGSYRIECYIDNKLVGSEIATVSEGLTTTLIISPNDSFSGVKQQRATQTAPIKKPSAQSETKLATVAPFSTKNTAPQKATKKTTRKKTSSKSTTPGKIVLAANVENARFVLDGKTMGAGNLTYSKISVGSHKYTVSADGYKEAAGTIKIKSGEKRVLSVSLTPLATAAKAKAYTGEDYYYSATNAFKTKDYQTAITDFTRAIEQNPAYAAAYYYRGEAHTALRDKEAAHDDFLRAAEQFQFKKKYADAVTAYNHAVKSNNKSIIAYIGRGNLYLQRNESFAAVADFELAVKLDKRNFQAQYGLGKARFQQNNYKKAIDHFKKANSLDKNDPVVQQYLMLSYLARDDYKKVRKTFDKFKKMATDEQMARFRADNKYSAILKVVEKN